MNGKNRKKEKPIRLGDCSSVLEHLQKAPNLMVSSNGTEEKLPDGNSGKMCATQNNGQTQ